MGNVVSSNGRAVRVGDQIRARQFTAGARVAAAIYRGVASHPARKEPIAIRVSGEAYYGLIDIYFGLLGARDAGHVDPAGAADVDQMLDEWEPVRAAGGVGNVSRQSVAFFLTNLMQVLPVVIDVPTSLGSGNAEQQVAALADVLQDTLEAHEHSAPAFVDDTSRGGRDHARRKAWWKFW